MDANYLFNWVDFLILTINIIDIIMRRCYNMNLIYGETDLTKVASILKQLRIFRVLFFSKALEPLNVFIEAFVKTLEQIGLYTILIVIIAFSFSLIG